MAPTLLLALAAPAAPTLLLLLLLLLASMQYCAGNQPAPLRPTLPNAHPSGTALWSCKCRMFVHMATASNCRSDTHPTP
jgi:hypothetical protein